MQDAFMRRHAIRIALVIIAFAAAATIAIGDVVRRSAARKLHEAILAELQPVVLKNCTLKRFGSANDGGYLMCENLIEPLDAAYLVRRWQQRRLGMRAIAPVSRPGASVPTVLILPGQPATAARSCFTTNVSAIAAATEARIFSTRWKTRSGRTATLASA